MASRPNGFLIDAFKDRALRCETLLASSVATHDIDELKNLVDRFAERTERLRNQRFQNNLDTIINCVAFKRSCGMGVGKWLNPINIGLSGAVWYWGGAESTPPP